MRTSERYLHPAMKNMDWRQAIVDADPWIGWDTTYCYWCGQTETEGHTDQCMWAIAAAYDAERQGEGAGHPFQRGGLLSTTCARPDCLQAPAAAIHRAERQEES